MVFMNCQLGEIRKPRIHDDVLIGKCRLHSVLLQAQFRVLAVNASISPSHQAQISIALKISHAQLATNNQHAFYPLYPPYSASLPYLRI